MLEDVCACHGDVHREPRGPQRPGELEKLARVIGGTFSREDDAVVAGVLALEPQPMERVPDEWMEPVQRGCKATASCTPASTRRTWASSCSNTSRRFRSGQHEASSGSKITGRTTPQVSGMAETPLWTSSTFRRIENFRRSDVEHAHPVVPDQPT